MHRDRSDVQLRQDAKPSSTADGNRITHLLQQVSAGSSGAQNDLLNQVYAELRNIAQHHLRSERPGHTLQATALVHEAYLRMLGAGERATPAWGDRGHFYRAAAEAMRRILVEHARRRASTKRGGQRKRVLLNVCDLAEKGNSEEILAVDDAISRLEKLDPAASEVVRLRFFAGLSNEQVAKSLGISERSVRREWTYARAKLFRLMEEAPAE